ncbi:GNAT family N-acetyltransferase [Nocardia sp. alder85J]|uniref:GNAT family N-acetyltransferase n=1 Tax=Nocardia sp. alder85J TaxID=2862949 RepID=UPI001CD63302|nr:hypothetical protein [Nocardia sp. alder85J]MCX4092350.1 hypothetical protein [Nocardia sp. alder85J]
MSTDAPTPFVPEDFDVPDRLETSEFRLEPLGPQHNDADYAAWTGSIDHIRATPGFPERDWPPCGGMSLEDNRNDLVRHADDFSLRRGFTYTVLDESGVVIGCVYIYPDRTEPGSTDVRSWVTADHAESDRTVYRAVFSWLRAEWPFDNIVYAERPTR